MNPALRTGDDGAILVALELLDVAAIRTEAERLHEHWRNHPNPRYRRPSSVDGQAVGLLGEHAVAEWVRRAGLGVRMIGNDPKARREGLGDVAVGVPNAWPPRERTVEVKAQRDRDWKRGPVMDGGDLYRYDIPVVWCVVGNDPWSGPVTIVGWFHPAEIRTQMHEDLLDDPFGGDGIRVWPSANRPRALLDLLLTPHQDVPPFRNPFE